MNKHEWIRTRIRTLEAQIDEKNKNIEARQNVTGSYKKKSVLKIMSVQQDKLVSVERFGLMPDL